MRKRKSEIFCARFICVIIGHRNISRKKEGYAQPVRVPLRKQRNSDHSSGVRYFLAPRAGFPRRSARDGTPCPTLAGQSDRCGNVRSGACGEFCRLQSCKIYFVNSHPNRETLTKGAITAPVRSPVLSNRIPRRIKL